MPFNIAFLALNVVVLIWHFAITHRYRLPRGPAWLRLLIAVGIFFLALLASTRVFRPHHTFAYSGRCSAQHVVFRLRNSALLA